MTDDNKENKGTEDTPKFKPRTIRVLHFEKLVPQNNIDSVPEKGKNSERIYRQFFCTGYYDRLSYVRAGEGEVFDYKHCFLIKYPYKQLPKYLYAYKLMTLFIEF